MSKNKEKNEVEEEKKFWNLTKNQWGWVSTFTNGLSVIVQMNQLLSTKRAQSFDMRFIKLMTLLNFWYFLVAILQKNVGYAIATFAFVVYNISVMFFHYCGVGGKGSFMCKKPIYK